MIVSCKRNHQCLPHTFSQSFALYPGTEYVLVCPNCLMLQLHINLYQLKLQKPYMLLSVTRVDEL
jgi:hypothetical protein